MRATSIVTTMAAAAVLATAFGSLAVASTAEPGCSGAATPGSATASSVAKSLEELGYRVDQVEAKYGCWKAEAINDSNIPIEALYDGSGALLAADLD